MEKGYDSGLRYHIVIVLNRTEAQMGKFGLDSAGQEWTEDGAVHADVTWAKGKYAMNAGSLDAYAVKMVRMNWNNIVTERSRIVYDGKTYQILPDTFHRSKFENRIQFHMQLLVTGSENGGSSSYSPTPENMSQK